MLPLWRDHIAIALCPERVTLVRLARGLRPHVTLKRSEAVQPQAGGAPWRAALAKLTQILGEPEWQNADATVVLSNHFARYACIPWNKEASGEDEQLALARLRFAHIYGDAAQQAASTGSGHGWELRLSAAPEAVPGATSDGAPRLASAVDGGLLDALRQAAAQNRLALRSIQPYLMASFNLFAGRIKKGGNWFATVENGKLCLALVRDGQWQRIQTHHDGMEKLKAWLDRENLASGLREPCREVLLFAPEAEMGQATLAPYQVRHLELPACEGFSPSSDARYAMAMSGVL